MDLRTKRRITGVVAVIAGCLVNFLGDRLLGVSPELWWGLTTFNLAWTLDIFVVPLIAGIVVAMIFGLGGKWLCYVPPVIVRTIGYLNFLYYDPIPAGAQLLTIPLWLLIVILVVEAAAFGGVIGEIIVKRTYGRFPRHMVYREKTESGSSDSKG